MLRRQLRTGWAGRSVTRRRTVLPCPARYSGARKARNHPCARRRPGRPS